MQKKLSKGDAKKKIDNYFKQNTLDQKETKKIKRVAMRHKIRLGNYRKRFCKKCLSDLGNGKVRIVKNHKIVECKCGYKNKIRM